MCIIHVVRMKNVNVFNRISSSYVLEQQYNTNRLQDNNLLVFLFATEMLPEIRIHILRLHIDIINSAAVEADLC